MAKPVTFSTEFQATVDRARALARESGEWHDTPAGHCELELGDEVRAAIKDWLDSGDYDRIVAQIVANDPELATQ